MERIGFLTTPSELAREIIAGYRDSGVGPFKVFALWRSPGDILLPEGSKISRMPTYFGLKRFIRKHNLTKFVCVASLDLGSLFLLLEAICDRRVATELLKGNRITPSMLLEFIASDMATLGVEIMHPHRINPALRLSQQEAVGSSRGDVTNLVRSFVASSGRPPSSWRTLSEASLLGMTQDGQIKHIEAERHNTDSLLATLDTIDKSQFQRIILVKDNVDHTSIAYPVIGVETMRKCALHGVTDILVSVDCVIQGKNSARLLAIKNNISVRVLTNIGEPVDLD